MGIEDTFMNAFGGSWHCLSVMCRSCDERFPILKQHYEDIIPLQNAKEIEIRCPHCSLVAVYLRAEVELEKLDLSEDWKRPQIKVVR